MKVAVVASGHIPSRWAHSINTVKHAQAFFELGYNVELITVLRWIDDQNKKKVKNFQEWYGVNSFGLSEFKDKTLFYYDEFPFFGKILRSIDGISRGWFGDIFHPEKRISQYLEKERFDLCYSRSYRVMLYNMQKGIPTILETHNPHPEKNNFLKQLLKCSTLDSFLGISTIHSLLKQRLVKMGFPQQKICVCEDAVDYKLFAKFHQKPLFEIRKNLNLLLDRTIVGYVGHLYKGRGIEDVIKLAELMPDVYFLFVGGNPKDVEYYTHLSAKDNLCNVCFMGHVPASKVPVFCAAFDALIMPYTRQTPTWEHMSPIKMFEFLAAGKPIIATDLPSIKKVLKDGENGFLVKEGDVNAMMKAVRTAQEADVKEKIFKKNTKLAQEFTYQKRCENIINSLAFSKATS